MSYFEFVERVGLDAVSSNPWTSEPVEQDWVDEEKQLFKDKWGVVCGLTLERISYPVKGPIERPEDLKHYTPPDPEDPALYAGIKETAARYKGKRAVLAFARDGWIEGTMLRGMENMLMDMIENPRFVHDVIDVAYQYNLVKVRRNVRAGADVIVLGDDYSDKNAPLMGPKFFEEFVLPRLRGVVQAAKEEGAYVIKHTDGNIWSIMEMIVGTGIDCINPLEPVAGMDIARVKRDYGVRVCLAGNIDCGDLLCRESPEKVKRVVRETIRTAAPGGGFMLSSSNSIHSGVRPQNYLAMCEACREYGEYPIL